MEEIKKQIRDIIDQTNNMYILMLTLDMLKNGKKVTGSSGHFFIAHHPECSWQASQGLPNHPDQVLQELQQLSYGKTHPHQT